VVALPCKNKSGNAFPQEICDYFVFLFINMGEFSVFGKFLLSTGVPSGVYGRRRIVLPFG
jgi:hypothetical protein